MSAKPSTMQPFSGLSVAEIISHYCTNFLLALQANCSKFFASKVAKAGLCIYF